MPACKWVKRWISGGSRVWEAWNQVRTKGTGGLGWGTSGAAGRDKSSLLGAVSSFPSPSPLKDKGHFLHSTPTAEGRRGEGRTGEWRRWGQRVCQLIILPLGLSKLVNVFCLRLRPWLKKLKLKRHLVGRREAKCKHSSYNPKFGSLPGLLKGQRQEWVANANILWVIFSVCWTELKKLR